MVGGRTRKRLGSVTGFCKGACGNTIWGCVAGQSTRSLGLAYLMGKMFGRCRGLWEGGLGRVAGIVTGYCKAVGLESTGK